MHKYIQLHTYIHKYIQIHTKTTSKGEHEYTTKRRGGAQALVALTMRCARIDRLSFAVIDSSKKRMSLETFELGSCGNKSNTMLMVLS